MSEYSFAPTVGYVGARYGVFISEGVCVSRLYDTFEEAEAQIPGIVAALRKLGGPQLSDDQISWGMGVVSRWMYIRQQAGQPIASSADITKSCLLGLMLQGGEPLPDPPPTKHAAPWYDLIEDGEGWALFAYLLPDGRVLIDGCDDWFVVEGTWEEWPVVLDRKHRWTKQPMGERWQIEPGQMPVTSILPEVSTHPAFRLTRLP